MGVVQTGADLDLDPRPTDLVALVGGVVTQALGLTPHAIHLDAAVPALPATVDATRLERVVANLLANAVKYSPGGGDITVAVRREDGATGPQAVIAVHDRSLGIPAADLPHIFQRFRRGSNVRDRIVGSGIGLASVRQIVDWHGGTVAVESEEGVGSTFTVCLPLADAPGRTAGE